MFLQSRSALQNLLLASAVAAVMALAPTLLHAQDDPTFEAGRVSSINGTVSVQPAGSDNWIQAYVNLPLGPGDRIYTDSDARAEIQIGQTFVRIAHDSDVTFVDATPRAINLGVAQGSAHIHIVALWPGQAEHVNTPSGSATIAQQGDLRVDVLPDQGTALFTDFLQDVFISGAGGFGQHIENGQALELAGSNPVVPQLLEPASPDGLDRWSQQRDQLVLNAASYRYVSPEIPGAAELDANGEWLPGTDYGAIWFPTNVPAGWAPYHYGHWVNHAPWGWVWIEDESWGYAPFHYGRWVNFNGRWGWVPGPPAAHPAWSPALVVFAGGIHFGGVGVSVWFPLGPGEAYRPWYPCSPRYIDQVNISNITESRVVHVQTTYVNIVNVTNVVYVNRTIGVTAMNHDDFAAGRSAAQVNVKIDVHQLDHVTVLDRPEPKPTVASFGRAPARPVPVKTERPLLINEQGKQVSAKPGAPPMEPPVRPAPPIRPIQGHPIANPANSVKPQPVIHPVTAQPAKPAPEPSVKPEDKPMPEKTVEPPAKPAAQPEDKTAVKPASKPESKPAPKAKDKTDKDKKDEK